MLRQEELAFIEAISTLQVSHALIRELRIALSRRKKPVVFAGSRGITSGGGARAPQRPSGQLTGKRKANEVASSGESFEPANRRPAPSEGSAPLPASASAVFLDVAKAFDAVWIDGLLLRFAQVSAPQLELWLGLASCFGSCEPSSR